MPQSLVIVESPNKVKTINKYLGDNFIVKSSKGHIRDLSKGRFATLKQILALKQETTDQSKPIENLTYMGVDPRNEWSANYEIAEQKDQVVAELKKAAATAELIYLATDLDREGEAIAWHLEQVLGGDPSRYRRVVFNEITKPAIQSAFKNPGTVNRDRVNAQQARRFLDRVVGFELTPLLTAKVGKHLSAGRVQSVAVRLVVEREKEIRAFNVEEYWEIFAHLSQQQVPDGQSPSTYKFQVTQSGGNKVEIPNEQDAHRIVSELARQPFVVTSHEHKPTESSPSAPFTTSTLQQTASTLLKFNVRKTMQVAQTLYEEGLITYMRTDSTSLSTSAVNTVRTFIDSSYGSEYVAKSVNVFKTKARSAQEAHEAIRPTDVSKTSNALRNSDQKRLYDLIRKRFIACQMARAKYQSVVTKVAAGDYELMVKGRVVVFDGFTKVYSSTSAKEEHQILPDFKVGEQLQKQSIEPVQKFTRPPPRFTEASLVRELEKRGIGRPSTYAPTISTIQERGYIALEKGKCYAQRIGEIVTSRLEENFTNLMEYEFTAKMEEDLDKIALGEKQWRDVLDLFYADFSDRFIKAADPNDGMRRNRPIPTEIKCDKCSRQMLFRTNNNGVFLGCEGFTNPPEDQCRNTKSLRLFEPTTSGDDEESESRQLRQKEKCPLCDKVMNGYRFEGTNLLHICNDPDCSGQKLETNVEPPKDETRSTIDCNVCSETMQLFEGRYGQYFKCTSETCTNTRRVLKNGQVAPLLADPISMPELKCEGIDDHFVLREGRTGLFLAASKYPKHKQTRQVLVQELLPHANELDPRFKHLLDAPREDPDGISMCVRYSRKSKEHYVTSKQPKSNWVAWYKEGRWTPFEESTSQSTSS